MGRDRTCLQGQAVRGGDRDLGPGLGVEGTTATHRIHTNSLCVTDRLPLTASVALGTFPSELSLGEIPPSTLRSQSPGTPAPGYFLES